ncbi:MAG TPA: hypothetical protein VFK87_13165 [Steroidobacteraceae bacterium]|nr:hypothetical protein [Steroidobacteraceae bacterium]
MTFPLRTFEGSCHCGALSFRLQTALPVPLWGLRACSCRFCRKHGAATTSDPAGGLRFEIHQPAALQRYRFGLRTADFLLCRECGVYLGAQIATAHGAFGIINTLALTPKPAGLPPPACADYGAESVAERIARRATRWTPLERPV